MWKKVLVGLILILVVGLACTQGEYPKTIKFIVSGTTGVLYSGNYGCSSAESITVNGTVPETHTCKMQSQNNIASGVFQKSQEPGTLTVQIEVGGEIKDEDTTTEAFGLVSVSYTPGPGLIF